ncbi:hypothetical protein LY76DRAFT_215107 [Colletotrichum caudatum]|nr:hypothetical protein LY76DRAFT_215107 [Colletotrichum caudatum]
MFPTRCLQRLEPCWLVGKQQCRHGKLRKEWNRRPGRVQFTAACLPFCFCRQGGGWRFSRHSRKIPIRRFRFTLLPVSPPPTLLFSFFFHCRAPKIAPPCRHRRASSWRLDYYGVPTVPYIPRYPASLSHALSGGKARPNLGSERHQSSSSVPHAAGCTPLLCRQPT